MNLSIPTNKNRKPLQDIIPLSRPLRVLIDPSSACNFRCKFCVHGMQDKPFGTVMKSETFNKVVARLLEFDEKPNIVHLFGLGEPLVNPLVPDFCRELKKNRVAKEVAITTNGSLLTHEISAQLISAGVDRITISLNGLNDKSFLDTCGVKLEYSKLFDEICYLSQIRNKNNHLHIKIIGNYYTEKEKEQFIDSYANLCDTINIDYLNNSWPGYDTGSGASSDMYTGAELTKGLVCPHVFYEMMINSDGSVSPCSLDYNYSEQNLGNVFDNSLVDIWNGELLNSIREETLRDTVCSYELCKSCYYPTSCLSVDITPYRNDLLCKMWPEKYRR